MPYRYLLRVAALSPQIFVYWNTAQGFALWASSGATDMIQTQSRLRIAMLLCRVLTFYCPLSLHYTLPGGDIDQLLIVGRSCHPLSVFKGGAASAISMTSISLQST